MSICTIVFPESLNESSIFYDGKMLVEWETTEGEKGLPIVEYTVSTTVDIQMYKIVNVLRDAGNGSFFLVDEKRI